MRTLRWMIALVATVSGLGVTAEKGAVASSPQYQRWQYTSGTNGCQVSGEGHSIPCCTVDGWDWSGNNKLHPVCAVLTSSTVAMSCATDQPLAAPRVQCPSVCGCGDAGNPFCGGLDATQHPDGSIDSGATYQCDRNDDGSQPEVCDGRSDGTLPVDKGCGADDFSCNAGDSDPAPIRYSSGRVESNPISVFELPAPSGVLFGYQLMYNSQVIRSAAQRNTINGKHDDHPVIHHSQEDTHFVGFGWLDNFSDRLFITATNTAATTIAWMSQTGTVTFLNNNGTWTSWSGKYELIDRGASPVDGLGRWVVRTADPGAPRQIWSFEELTYRPYDGSAAQTLGRLRRHAVLTSNLADLNGRYGFTVTWTPAGTIEGVVDTLGRSIEFDYHDELECEPSPPSVTPFDPCYTTEILSQRVSAVRYRPAPGAAASVVATLQTTPFPNNDRLERIELTGTAGYTRFLYQQVPPATDCVHCNALLTDVVIAGDAATVTPDMSAPVQPGEIVSEHDDYGVGATPGVMVGVHSESPGREYAYEYTFNSVTQFDLHQDGGPCGSGNTCTQPGYACRTVNQTSPHCYVADVIQHDTSTGLSTQRVSAGAGAPATGASGSVNAYARGFTAKGAPRNLTDALGRRTSYGYDTHARLRCIVRGDNDTQAFADPANPDTSACAGPTGSEIVRFDYAATTVTTTTTTALGNLVTVESVDPILLLPSASSETGMTKDVDGNLYSQTHTTTTAYDALGRVTSTDGPMDNALAYDVTDYGYYNSYDSAWPYNLGNIHTITKYAGSTASKVVLVTTYSEYDLFGIAHRVRYPNGEQLVLTTSADRLTWDATTLDSTGAVASTLHTVLNPDGSIRSQRDDAGVCMTFAYSDSTGYVGAPTMIRRSDTDCGVLPIDSRSGEVEIRTYINGEPDRLASIVRQTNGVVEASYSGFSYDRDRLRIGATTADAPTPITYGFTGRTLTSIAFPGGAVPGAGKSSYTLDAEGRPLQMSQFVDATNQLTHVYGYANVTALRPSTITSGYNGGATATSTYAYDDFGRLIEANVPEVGTASQASPTRYQYDVANRVVKLRSGVGTPQVSTTVYAYDSMDRLVSIDHDVEHPVDCTTSPAGTPIQDEEYFYDSCPTGDTPIGVTCDHALGRPTIAREILQCGASGDVVKRGRWYTYDASGHITQVSYATVTGNTIGPAATIRRSYDAIGRLVSYTSPLNDAFGTVYAYSPSSGQPISLATSETVPSQIAHDVTYSAFGDLTGMVTASTQTVAGGTRTLTISNQYRLDNALSGMSRTFAGSPGVTSIDLVNTTVTRTAAGLIQQRNDAADAASSRYYEYDALHRLTCEARTGEPGSCTTSSPAVAGLYTYGNGQTAASPANARTTAFVNFPGLYTSAAADSYHYGIGTQVSSLAAAGGTLTMTYDALGRRTSDYWVTMAGVIETHSRRDYTYLPNGQLGAIMGDTPNGDAYLTTIRYDDAGRPLLISSQVAGETTYYELFWDETGLLISAAISTSTSTKLVRWHYHYLQGTMVAATREVVDGTTTVKRFWPITDERGLVYRMVDEDGATYWQATWDAIAVRTLVGVSQPDMWVPFGLPGQLILDGTEAVMAATGTIAPVRPPLALNGLRSYDPLLGAFLQPDPLDQTDRMLPEGYLYGRGDMVNSVDVTGADSRKNKQQQRKSTPASKVNFDISCLSDSPDTYAILSDEARVNAIIQDIDTCKEGDCGDGTPFSAAVKTAWKNALRSGTYFCANDHFFPWDGWTWHLSPNGLPAKVEITHRAESPDDKDRYNIIVIPDWADTINSDKSNQNLKNRQTIFGTEAKEGCWAREIAHEALHGVLNSTPAAAKAQVGQGSTYASSWSTALGNFGHEVVNHLEKCIRCDVGKATGQ